MQIIAPFADHIQAMQDDDGRFCRSHLIGLILQKHGFVGLEGGQCAVVTRGVDAIGAVSPVIVEGPLAAPLAARFGLTTREHHARHVWIDDGAGAFWNLIFNRPNLRRIPPVGDKTPSEPFLYQPDDRRWAPDGFRFQTLEGPGRPLLHATLPNNSKAVVAMDVDGVLVLGVPLFDVLVQHYAAPPYPAGYYAMVDCSQLEDLERWLVRALTARLESLGEPYALLDPWPHPYRSCLSIRHDFDRKMEGAHPRVVMQKLALKQLFAAYARHDVKATWFWRVFSFEPSLMADIAARGHEIALHTDVPTGAFEEIAAEFRHFEQAGWRLRGITAHGGAGSIGYTGAPQVAAALAFGMSYGELAGSAGTQSCFAHVLDGDLMAATQLVMPAQHLSLDKGMKPEDHWLEEVLPQANAILAAGGHVVMMNHPDIHIPEMIAFCERVEARASWKATMLEAAEWYRATRSARLTSTASGVRLWFEEQPQHAAAAEIVTGSVRQRLVSEPGGRTQEQHGRAAGS